MLFNINELLHNLNMTEQIKKGSQVVKRNTEEEQCLVYLEASLGISVTKFSLLDTIVGKGNKIGEGLKNRVFINKFWAAAISILPWELFH